MRRCIATIDVYSVPWAPETKATIGPGRRPRITATGIEVPESLPAATTIAPYAVTPGAALADPTVNAVVCELCDVCCAERTTAPARCSTAANRSDVMMGGLDSR